jgi:SAM-dependent methyltransferase
MAKGAPSVLDLGCGTGQLAAALAREGAREVCGVDPAAPMLDIARARPGGDRVNWACDDARRVRLGQPFDLIVMTGHAFQVFLRRDDRLAALNTVAAHLSPGGRFVFDTRNPACCEWEEWTPERSREILADSELGDVVVWNDVERDPATGIVTYQTHYEVEGEGRRYSASARIAFPERGEVEALVAEAGLRVETLLGDWDASPWHADAREIIVVGGAA